MYPLQKVTLLISLCCNLQKKPGANPPDPPQAPLRLRVLRSPPPSPASHAAAAAAATAVPGRRHRLVSPSVLSGSRPLRLFVGVLTRLSVCRDLSVDAGLPHHQYQLQQLPQHYQHYLASPRMHHFPRNTSSAQVVCGQSC